jgi:cell division protein FtsB
MSTPLARAFAPAPGRFDGPKAVGLRLVRPVRSRAKRAPFVVVLLTVVTAGLVGLILMSTVLQAQAFESSRLQREARDLTTRQQQLGREVSQLQSPANVAREAVKLGMVPNANPAFLRLSDAKVLGKPVPATAERGIKAVAP